MFSRGGKNAEREEKSTARWNAAFHRRREQIAYKTRRVHALRIRSGRRSRHANEKGRTNEQKSSSLAGRERVKRLRISALISRVFPNNAHAKSNDSHHPLREDKHSVQREKSRGRKKIQRWRVRKSTINSL